MSVNRAVAVALFPLLTRDACPLWETTVLGEITLERSIITTIMKTLKKKNVRVGRINCRKTH